MIHSIVIIVSILIFLIISSFASLSWLHYTSFIYFILFKLCFYYCKVRAHMTSNKFFQTTHKITAKLNRTYTKKVNLIEMICMMRNRKEEDFNWRIREGIFDLFKWFPKLCIFLRFPYWPFPTLKSNWSRQNCWI